MSIPRFDFTGRTWLALIEDLEAREEKYLKDLANPSVGFEATQVLRGKLAEIRRIRSLGEPGKQIDTTSKSYL